MPGSGSSEKARKRPFYGRDCYARKQAEPKGNELAKKVNYHTVAIKYLKRNGIKIKSGSWQKLRPLLSQVSGVSSPHGMGYKAGGIAILKQLGFENPKKPKARKKKNDVNSDEFLASYEWRKLRMKVLEKFGARCQCCGRSRADGISIHVDHIKPRRKYPELALEFDNLQVLCNECNHGKGNWSETDWRDPLSEAFRATMAE